MTRPGSNCAVLTGANPRTELIQGGDGDFYGTTRADGVVVGPQDFMDFQWLAIEP